MTSATSPASSPQTAPPPHSTASSAAIVVVASPTPAASQTTFAITLTPAPAAWHWYESPLLAASIALCGVIYTVRAAGKRMRSELDAAEKRATAEREHAREQAGFERQYSIAEGHQERISTARRIVYLDAAEKLIQAQSFIGGLANLDLTRLADHSQLMPFAEAVNKIAVLGEIETVRTAREIFQDMNIAFFRSLEHLAPLAGYRAAIEVHQKEFDAANTQQNRIVAEMRNHNESTTKNQEAFVLLQRSFELERQRAERANKLLGEERLKAIELEREHAFSMIGYTEQIAMKVDLLADSIRRELGLQPDLPAFQEQTRQMLAVARASLERLIGQTQ